MEVRLASSRQIIATLHLTVHFSTFNVHQLSPGSPYNIDPQLRPWSRLAYLLKPVRLLSPSASRSRRLHFRTCRDVHLCMLDTRCFQSNLRDLAISCPLDQFELHEKKGGSKSSVDEFIKSRQIIFMWV